MAPKPLSSPLNHCHVTTTPTIKPPHTFSFPFLFHKPTTTLFHSLSSSSSPLHLPRVTTAPINYLPPPQPPHTNFPLEISRLKSLLHSLSSAHSPSEKLAILNNDTRVREFCMKQLGEVLEEREMYLVKCVVAAGQGHVVEWEGEGGDVEEREMSGRSLLKSALYSIVEMIEGWDNDGAGVRVREKEKEKEKEAEALRKLVKVLEDVERFYDCIGGIIGYQIKVLELLSQSDTAQTTDRSQTMKDSMKCQIADIHPPNGLDLSNNMEYAAQAALWGIEGLPYLGEIYPLGGSADRLGLVDPDTRECLPAAMLPHCGRTLLEGLIRDLQAREFLYFKLYGKQCITPVAIMTSAAKNNHNHITSLCEKHQWFGRGRSKFILFEQPLVPAISAEDGEWLVSEPFTPVCKPGGHGVIWKLAYDKGVFQWFKNHGREGATVRQVSNVVAATDLTLLALAGIGLHHRKKLGFASCERNPGATEGINVLIEKKEMSGRWAYGLSCIEYTEFDKFGMTGATSPKRVLEDFPANTNILYVDLKSAEEIGSRKDDTSLPGLVLNIKKKIEFVDHYGIRHSVPGGRLECTMQNIADNFFNTFASRRYGVKEDILDTFIVYNERRRVTSSAKKRRRHGSKSFHQTPEGALLDIMRNAYDLLSSCNIKIPKVQGNENYIDSGPPYLILLHPALGPLWEIARQKFHGGSISEGSELQIEVAEFCWRHVQLDGSMIIKANNVMGSMGSDGNGEPIIEYGHRCARCKLHNVRIMNKGIDWNSEKNTFWKHEVHRHECFEVVLHGNAEFEAVDVTIRGNHVFEVPDGYRLKITSGDPGLSVQLDPMEYLKKDSGSWCWNYKIEGTHVKLEMVEL